MGSHIAAAGVIIIQIKDFPGQSQGSARHGKDGWYRNQPRFIIPCHGAFIDAPSNREIIIQAQGGIVHGNGPSHAKGYQTFGRARGRRTAGAQDARLPRRDDGAESRKGTVANIGDRHDEQDAMKGSRIVTGATTAALVATLSIISAVAVARIAAAATTHQNGINQQARRHDTHGASHVRNPNEPLQLGCRINGQGVGRVHDENIADRQKVHRQDALVSQPPNSQLLPLVYDQGNKHGEATAHCFSMVQSFWV